MKTKKVSLDKFSVTKLTNTKRIFGGNTVDGEKPPTYNTEADPPKQQCINTSNDYV